MLSFGIVAWEYLRRDCLKQNNENGKRNRVESTIDIVTIASGVLGDDDYVLSVIENLLLGIWVMNFDCSFHATQNGNYSTTHQ